MQNASCCCPVLNKIRKCRHTSVKLTIIIFRENSFSRSLVLKLRTDGRSNFIIRTARMRTFLKRKCAQKWVSVTVNVCYFILFTSLQSPIKLCLPLILINGILSQFHYVAVDSLAVCFRFLNWFFCFNLSRHRTRYLIPDTSALATEIPAHFFGFDQTATRICLLPCKFLSRFLNLFRLLLEQTDACHVKFRNQVQYHTLTLGVGARSR